MTVLPAVRDQLAEASRRLDLRRAIRRRIARLLALAAAAVLALGGVAVATGVVRWPGLSPHVRVSDSPPPPDQLAALGVLRRPQTEADRSPVARRAASAFVGGIGPRVRFGPVRLAAVRVLGVRHGETYVLVPRTREVWSTATDPPVRRTKRDVLCIVTVAPRYGSGGGCATTQDVERGLVLTGHRRTTAALVPDRVAAIRVDTCEGVTDIPVRDNFVTYDRLPGWRDVGRVAWLDARGREIGGFSPTPHHPPASLTARCVRRGDARP